MSPLLRKEIRLLLPSFSMGLLLCFTFALIPQHSPESMIKASLYLLPFVFFPAMVIMMALQSYGREISSGTFSSLLAQPVSRSRLWWTKAGLLALALLILWGAWVLAFLEFIAIGKSAQDIQDLLTVSGVLMIAAFSGGLWAVLLFRQVTVAFWFTILTPAALILGVVNGMDKHLEHVNTALTITFFVYGVVGFLWAWRMFLRAQDYQWKGGAITLPALPAFSGWFVRRNTKPSRRPRTALFLKELQLQQSQLVMAGVLALLHLGVVAARSFVGSSKKHPTLEFVFEYFWVIWLIMPLLTGSAAVAEERKLGTLEGQLCLPARRRLQFGIKLIVVLALAVVLGGLMPVLLEGNTIFPKVRFTINPTEFDSMAAIPLQALDYFGSQSPGVFAMTLLSLLVDFLLFISPALPLIILSGISVIVAALATYASTVSRSTLQALAPSLLIALLTYLALGIASEAKEIFGVPLWEGPLIYLIGVPVMALTLIGLMYWNFKRVFVGWSVMWRNLVTLTLALGLVMASTALIYHRAWEFLTAREPAHGSARMAEARDVYFSDDRGGLCLRFPDGRAWTGRHSYFASFWSVLNGGLKMRLSPSAGFLDGTNWASVAMTSRAEVIGIQTNGSLWVSDPVKPGLARLEELQGSPRREPVRLAKMPGDAHWKSVATSFDNIRVFLLNADGTLWAWGTNRFDWSKKVWPGLRAFEPQRLGTRTDWTEIFRDERGTYFRERGGAVWRNSPFHFGTSVMIEDLTVNRASLLEGQTWRSLVWSESFDAMRVIELYHVGVRDDGTLWAGSNVKPAASLVRLGNKSNWVALAESRGTVIALEADGSLWKWKFPSGFIDQPQMASAEPFSRQRDWIAITTAMHDGVVGLAADGSLWRWRFPSPARWPGGGFGRFGFTSMLTPSRKPEDIGNIFDGPQ